MYSNGIPLTSDKKLKKNIRKLDDTDDIFEKLNFCHYQKNISDEFYNEVGVIADDIKILDPENKYGIWEQKNDNLYIHYTKIFGLMGFELQKLKKEVDELKNKLK